MFAAVYCESLELGEAGFHVRWSGLGHPPWDGSGVEGVFRGFQTPSGWIASENILRDDVKA